MKKIEINLSDDKIISLIWATSPIQKLIISKKTIKEEWLEEKDFVLEASGKWDNTIQLKKLWDNYFTVNELLTKIKWTYIKQLNQKYTKLWIEFVSKY